MPLSSSKKITPTHHKTWTGLNFNTTVSIVLIAAATAALLMSMAGSISSDPVGDSHGTHLRHTTVTGFFLQDDDKTDPGTFDAMKQNFGLISREYDTDTTLPVRHKAYTQWERFAHKLEVMNKEAPTGTSYRLLYLGRHGQGYHNIGSEFYGSEAWDCYYSTLDKDINSPSVVFSDAHLTKLGINQAKNLSIFWQDLLTTQHIPAPKSYYTSPLTRAIQTSIKTFSPLTSLLPSSAPYRPIIKELLREGHGIHTCDRRPSKSYLTSTFPILKFLPQDHFPESDDLYSSSLREPPSAHVGRMTLLLGDILTTDSSTYISMTSHSGSIAAMLRAIGHRAFSLPTGGAIPVIVKVEIVNGRREKFDLYDKTGWEVKPDCEHDPKTAGIKGFKDIGEYVKYVEDAVVSS